MQSKKRRSEPVSRILSAFAPMNATPCDAASESFGATTIPLASPLLARSSNRPGSFGRAVLKRFPIWSCSVRGFACHPCYHGRGALLPHLFTIASAVTRACARATARSAVYFLCHCPSSCPDRALPGALPCGVRTFLLRRSPKGECGDDRLAHCDICNCTTRQVWSLKYEVCLVRSTGYSCDCPFGSGLPQTSDFELRTYHHPSVSCVI